METKTIASLVAIVAVVAVVMVVGYVIFADSDGDGWSDFKEKNAGTNPYNVDTDNDGIWDPHDPNPLVAFSSTPTSTATPVSGESYPTKKDALDFSLELVETYFTSDEDKFCSHLADTIYSLEGDGSITKKEAISSIKGSDFPFGEDYSKYTMDDYLRNYRPKIMDYEDYSKKYPGFSRLSIDGWTPDADDFLFLGHEVKTGKEGFMWDDLLVFMVTCQNGKWEFIASSG